MGRSGPNEGRGGSRTSRQQPGTGRWHARLFTRIDEESRAMNCPCCNKPSLAETMTREGALVDVCKECKGVWLDRGEVYLFSRRPKVLEAALTAGQGDRRPSARACPRCRVAMEVGPFLKPELEVDHCPQCEG